MKYTVNRKMWARGGRAGYPALRNDAGKQCCLGFVGRQCGIPISHLKNEPLPCNVENHTQRAKWPKWFINQRNGNNTKDCILAAATNDKKDITDKVREAKLKKLFAKHGDRIVFVN